MNETESWHLSEDHKVYYFSGQETLRKLLKNVTKALKGQDIDMISFAVSYDLETGHFATLVYVGSDIDA